MSDDPDDTLIRFDEVRRELESRWPESRIAPTLDRIRRLTGYLGDPQHAFPVIQVTGTNGKTSTARMIEGLLREFGLHTGLVTSPHLTNLRERIRLDGEPIQAEAFLRIYDEVAPVLELVDAQSEAEDGPRLSFFEAMTGLAFAAFADAPVDVAVIEVGMGGRWDATNVADAQVAVIGPIGMDHMDYLGETLGEIAGEKAGIIKPAAQVVLAAQEPEAAEVVLATAVQLEATTAVEGLHFGVVDRTLAVGGQQVTLHGLGGDYEDIYLPLFGEHQARNAALALTAVESFFGIATDQLPGAVGADGPMAAEVARALPEPLPGLAEDVPLAVPRRQLDPAVVRAGFARATSPGRLEVVRRAPTVVVDATHNPHGAGALAEAFAESFGFTRVVGVIGILADKDARGILAALDPILDEVVITRSSSPRALPPEELGELARTVLGPDRVTVVERLDEALERAVALAEIATPVGVGAGVLVTGSITVVAEARLLLGAESGGADGDTRPDHLAPRAHLEEEDDS